MARLETRLWRSAHDLGDSRRHRQSIPYQAYVPDPLVGRPILLPPDVMEDLNSAEGEIRRLNESGPVLATHEAVARLLLRAEAVASSRIEGLVVDARRLLRAEAGVALGGEGHERQVTAEAVLGNIEAMQFAVDDLSKRLELSVEGLREMHRALMRHTPTPHIGGEVRTTQNWIGGSFHGPYDARFVPPPPELVPGLLEDLVAYLNAEEHPPLLQAALAHAQFELIHPFADGNGRIGRAIVHIVLMRRGLAPRFVPPISVVLATHHRGYLRGLQVAAYLGKPTGEQAVAGTADWLRVFAAASARAAADALAFGRQVDALETQWRKQVGAVRRDSATDHLLGALASAPVVTVSSAARLINRSIPATNAAVEQLAAAGVLVPTRSVRRNRAFEARGLVELFTSFERALASPAGDTHEGQPVRHVPARTRGPNRNQG